MPMGSSHSATEGWPMAHTQVSEVFKPAAIATSTFAAAVATFGAALTFAPQHAAATPAYAQQTGKACGSCHVSKSGGGALTKAGKAFQKSRK
jgi:mono/diheme cytochrome c family protein